MFSNKNLFVVFGKHTLIGFTAVAVAVVSVWFLSREITRISESVVKNRQLADKLGKRTELFSVISRDASLVGKNDTGIENAFIPADNISEFTSALERIATKNNTPESFHFGSPISSATPAPFPLSTIEYQNSLSLNIFTFINYLKDFEQLPYFTKINSISFTSQGVTGWRGEGTANWNATLYTKTNQ